MSFKCRKNAEKVFDTIKKIVFMKLKCRKLRSYIAGFHMSPAMHDAVPMTWSDT